ncbi:MAG: hypothetical protein IKU21_00820 [Anaerotignum sp.]|nr:hypothetical protein [Anaerotignum sp.]
MKKYIFMMLLVMVLGLSGCGQAEPGMTREELEATMQTAEGRKNAILELHEEAEILSETVMEETGCIIVEFSRREAHDFMIFKPTENGYFWGEESAYYPENKIGKEYVTIGEEMYDVFLRHTDEVASLEVLYTHEENSELILKDAVNFKNSNVGWIRVTDVIPQYRVELVTAEIAGFDADGQEISLKNEITTVEPSTAEKTADALENITERKIMRLIIKGLMG